MRNGTKKSALSLCTIFFAVLLMAWGVPGKAFSQDEGIDVPETVLITAGSFTMGTDKTDVDGYTGATRFKEYPAHNVTIIHDYYMGKYEITNEQFAQFIDAGGYDVKEYWLLDPEYGHADTEEGWKWKEEQGRRAPAFHDYETDEDESWDLTIDPYWKDVPYSYQATMPVIGVSWFEAYAYCKWLSSVTGDTYRMPTEAEWEYAARGPESYRFPWGNEYLSAEKMCGQPGSGAMAKCWYTLEATDEDKATDEDAAPVGSYPEGVSPWGVYDMAGNVVEMTKDWFQGFYYYKQVRTGDTVDPTGPDGSLPPFFISVKPSWTTPERVYKSWGYAMSGSANSNYNRYLDTSYPLRGAHRTFHDNDLPHSQIGFRVMKEAP